MNYQENMSLQSGEHDSKSLALISSSESIYFSSLIMYSSKMFLTDLISRL